MLANTIPRRARVTWWLGLVLAAGFAALVTPTITAERWLLRFDAGTVAESRAAPFTVRAPQLVGSGTPRAGGGLVIARGEIATRDEAALADAIAVAMPRGALVYLAWFALTFALAAVFCHHLRRSTQGRLVRVQVVSLAVIAVLAVLVKLVLLSTALSALVVPVAALAMVATMALDRTVGLATGVLAAVVVSLLAPFDVGLAILLVVQAAAAGLVIADRPRAASGRPRRRGRRWLAALTAGLAAVPCTAATYLLLTYLSTGHAPSADPLHAAWLAAVIGPAVAAVIAVPVLPLYQRLVGEITQGTLVALDDLGHPLLRQIAEKSPGTWQHSLMMANLAELAAQAIGASGRLVRVGAYFHDLGKSLQAKYFVENLGAGETSPHDRLPPEASCDAIFAHVTEGVVAARKAGLHERIVDFMHMHHGNAVLDYFWAKCREQGNPHDFTVERFRYPGHPPHSRETAILAICDAVEAASRTLNKPEPAAIDALVQRIVYGKLHLGQLDDSGLSMTDLRRISDSLRETIRSANHARIEHPSRPAEHDASASAMPDMSTPPRLDSLDRKPARHVPARPAPAASPSEPDEAFAVTADVTDTTRPERLRAVPGRAPGPLPPALDLITPQLFEADAAAAARPASPAAPAPAISQTRSLRRGPSEHPPIPTDPSQVAAALASLASRVRAAPFGGPAEPADDGLDPLSPWSVPSDRVPGRDAPWSSELATRIDAALGGDDWNEQTPIVAPSEAELRILRGGPERDPPSGDIATRQRDAASQPGDAPRRSAHPTAEVDPDDIEAAIELAPPARRPTYTNLTGAAKPRKPSNKTE